MEEIGKLEKNTITKSIHFLKRIRKIFTEILLIFHNLLAYEKKGVGDLPYSN